MIDQFRLEFTSVPKYYALLGLYIIELIHDQLPLAVPCYDLVLVIEFTLGHRERQTSGAPNSLDLTGGEYKT